MMLKFSKFKFLLINLVFALFVFGFSTEVNAYMACPDNTTDIANLIGSLSMADQEVISDHFGDWCATFQFTAAYNIQDLCDTDPVLGVCFRAYFQNPVFFYESDPPNSNFVRKIEHTGTPPSSPSDSCDTSSATNNWDCDPEKSNWFCSSGLTKFADGISYDLGNQNNLASTIEAANVGLCVNPSTVPNNMAKITEVDYGLDSQYHLCLYDTALNTETWKSQPPPDVKKYVDKLNCAAPSYLYPPDVCCPINTYFIIGSVFPVVPARCYSIQDLNDVCLGGGDATSYGTLPTAYKTVNRQGLYNYKIKIPSDYFNEPDIPSYMCNGPKCVTVNGEIRNRGEYPYYDNLQTIDDILQEDLEGAMGCINNGEPDANSTQCTKNPLVDNDSCVCFYGSSFSASFYENIEGQAAAEIIMSCNQMPEDQVDLCMQCIVKNWTSDQTDNAYRWSASLGCIDTRMNPFITRIIQIGLGLGSGIAVLRIIQGAFMRQTNDPAKIQEGNEIIIATVLGLAVLAGSVVLLQIIGVDILNLFTFQEYTSIVGG